MTRPTTQKLLTPRWIITTLLVIAAAAVMIRLGVWQLDRLAERRAFNTAVTAQLAAPGLDLNQSIPQEAQLLNMEYRPVVVRGEYDPQNEIILRNQVIGGQPGYHLLTPLRIQGNAAQGNAAAVLVDRGFIPLTDAAPAARARFAQAGVVTLRGQIRIGHVPRYFGVPDPTLAPGQTHLDAWNAINIERIAGQTPYPMLPIYVELASDTANAVGGAAINSPQAALDSGASALSGDTTSDQPAVSPEAVKHLSAPLASLTQPDLSEGPHLGYAAQWFSFAGVLLLGYPFFVRKQLNPARSTRARSEKQSSDGRGGDNENKPV